MSPGVDKADNMAGETAFDRNEFDLVTMPVFEPAIPGEVFEGGDEFFRKGEMDVWGVHGYIW